MGRSIYSPHRVKSEFTNPNLFRVGDEFKKSETEIIYQRLRDEKS